MLAGISTVCFASSYALALGLEVARLRSRRTVLRLLTVLALIAGLIAHTLYLAVRSRAAAASPLSSPFDWLLLAAWLLAVICLLMLVYYPRLNVGLFVLPLVLVLVGAAQFADPEPFAPSRASRFWGNLHGTFLLLGTVTITVGFASAVMYLAQDYRLRSKRLSGLGMRLPSLEWLERINRRTLAVSALFIGVGFIAGLILNHIKRPDGAGPLPWYDPVVLTSATMFLWLFAAELFRLTYRPARHGRKVAYLNLASFLFLAVALITLSLIDTRHGPSRPPAGVHQGASVPLPVSIPVAVSHRTGGNVSRCSI